jgi:LPS export ABC transporter protein LptC
MRGIRIILFVCVGVICTSCSLDYQDNQGTQELSDQIPEVIFTGFSHTAVKESKLVFTLEAEEAQLFQKQKRTVMTGVRFRQYDDNGKISIEGHANRAVYFTDTENAEIYGAVFFRSNQEEITMYAESLFWDHQQRMLTANAGEAVRIVKDDGSSISGRGFSADARKKSINYSSGVQGTYVHEDEK